MGTLGAGDRAVRDALVSIGMVGVLWLAKLQKRAAFNARTRTAADHLSFPVALNRAVQGAGAIGSESRVLTERSHRTAIGGGSSGADKAFSAFNAC